jgi:uncharacterized membrane protein YhaH (DUF805 family)
MDALLLTTFLEVIGWIMMAGFLVLVIWLFVFVFTDIFRRRDLSGLGKAGWIFLIFVLPLIGTLIYLATRPRDTTYSSDIGVIVAQQAEAAATEEIARAQQLLESGTITQQEFNDIKARALS